MTRVETTIKTADGQTIILSPADKITREITLECASNRCASRHGQDKPAEVTLLDDEMPEAGDQWMTLILPSRSPQYSPMPPTFCSGQCVKDFLTYFYQLPSPRNPAPPASVVASAENVQLPVAQADGYASDPGDEHQEGENPVGPRFL
jgi:hypothetical protein